MIKKKICLLGSVAVGKTSLIRRFVQGIFSERYLTTIGVKIDRKILLVGGHKLTLIVWDLSGEDEFAQIESRYLRGASGYILVADGTRKSTLEKAVQIQARTEKIVGAIPFVLAVNKFDLRDEWEVSEHDLKSITGRGWAVWHTSAKTGLEVEAIFTGLGQKLLDSRTDSPERRP